MTQLSEVTALVLVGGLGTRLRKVLSECPKVLAPVGGRPFLAYLLDQLESAGFRKVVLCTGYLGEQIENSFGVRYGNLELLYSTEQTPLGTGGALRLAIEQVAGELFLVLNGDSYVDVNLKNFYSWFQAHRFEGLLLLVEVENASRFGTVALGPNNTVQAFREKLGDARPGLINAGVYLLPRSWLELIPSERLISLERDLLPQWSGYRLGGYPVQAAFIDIGTPESYLQAESFFKIPGRKSV